MPLNEQDIHYFIDVAVTHLNKLTGHEIVLREPTIEFQSLVFSAYTGLLHLTGGAEGFVYLTASQQFLQNLSSRSGRSRTAGDHCQNMLEDIAGTLAQALQKKFGTALQISGPRLFSTVPDDPIEMPPAVFVQPLVWRKEHAYFVLGLASPEPS